MKRPKSFCGTAYGPPRGLAEAKERRKLSRPSYTSGDSQRLEAGGSFNSGRSHHGSRRPAPELSEAASTGMNQTVDCSADTAEGAGVPHFESMAVVPHDYVRELCSESETLREEAAQNIRILLEVKARASKGGVGRIVEELCAWLWSLISSRHLAMKLGALQLMCAMLAGPFLCWEDEKLQLPFLYLAREALQQSAGAHAEERKSRSGTQEAAVMFHVNAQRPSHRPERLITESEFILACKVAEAISAIAVSGAYAASPTALEDLLRVSCIEWLEGDQPALHQLAAARIVAELARYRTALFPERPRRQLMATHLWTAIHNPYHRRVRTAGVEALRSLLDRHLTSRNVSPEKEELPVECPIPLEADSARSASVLFRPRSGTAEGDARRSASDEEDMHAFEGLWNHLLAGLAHSVSRASIPEIAGRRRTNTTVLSSEFKACHSPEKFDDSKKMVLCQKLEVGRETEQPERHEDSQEGSDGTTSGSADGGRLLSHRAWNHRGQRISERATQAQACTANHLPDPVQEGSLLALAELLEVASYSEEMREQVRVGSPQLRRLLSFLFSSFSCLPHRTRLALARILPRLAAVSGDWFVEEKGLELAIFCISSLLRDHPRSRFLHSRDKMSLSKPHQDAAGIMSPRAPTGSQAALTTRKSALGSCAGRPADSTETRASPWIPVQATGSPILYEGGPAGSSTVKLPARTDALQSPLARSLKACTQDNSSVQFSDNSPAILNSKAARQVFRRSGCGVSRQATEACAAFKCLSTLGMQFSDAMEQQVDQFIPDILKAIELKLVVFHGDRTNEVGEGRADRGGPLDIPRTSPGQVGERGMEQENLHSHAKVPIHAQPTGTCQRFLEAQETSTLTSSNGAGYWGETVLPLSRSACSTSHECGYSPDERGCHPQARQNAALSSEDQPGCPVPRALDQGASPSGGAIAAGTRQSGAGSLRHAGVVNARLVRWEASPSTAHAGRDSCRSTVDDVALPLKGSKPGRLSPPPDFTGETPADLSKVMAPSARLCPVCSHVRSSVRAAQELVRHAALLCVSKLIRALGRRMQGRLDLLLQSMFAGGINRSLLKALRLLVDCSHVRQAVQKHFVSVIQQDLKTVEDSFLGLAGSSTDPGLAAGGQAPGVAARTTYEDRFFKPGTVAAAAASATAEDPQTKSHHLRLARSCWGCRVELHCPAATNTQECVRDVGSANAQTTEKGPTEMMMLALQGAYLFGVDDTESRLLIAESALQLVFHPHAPLRAAATFTLCRLLLCPPADTGTESGVSAQWQLPHHPAEDRQGGRDLTGRQAVALASSFSGVRGAVRHVECETSGAVDVHSGVETADFPLRLPLRNRRRVMRLDKSTHRMLTEPPGGDAEAAAAAAAAGDLLRGAAARSDQVQALIGTEMSRAERTRVWWEQEQMQQQLFLQRQREVLLLRQMFPAVSTDVAVEVRMAAVSGLDDAGDAAAPLMRSSLDLVESLLAFCLDDDAEVRRKAVSVLCRVCCIEQPLLSVRGLTGLAVHYMSQIVLASTRQCLVLSQALPQTAELLASLCVYARVLLAAFIRPAVELIVQCLRQAVLGSDQPAQASPSAEPGKERDFQYGFSQILRRQGRTSGSVSGYELAGKKTCFHEDSQMSEGMVRCVPGGRRGPGERAIPTVLADRSGVLPDRFADSDFGQRSVYESCGTCSGVLTFDLVQSGEVSDCVTVAPRLSPVSSETNWRSGEGEYRGFTLFDGPSSIFSSSQRPGTAVERPLRGAVSSEELDSSASDDASLLEEFAGDPSSAFSGDGALEHLSEVPAAGRRLASPNGVRKKGCSPSLLPKRRERQANCNPADEDRRGFRCSNHSRTSVDHGYVQALLETLEKFSLVADQALLQETFEAVLPLLTVVIVTPLSDGECVAAVSLLVALLRRTGNCSLPTERLRVLLRCFLAHLQPVLRQEDQGLRLEVMRAVGTLGAIGLETYWALGICGGTEAVTVRRRYSQSIIGLYPVGDRVDLGARGPLTSTKDTSFPAARRDEISAVVHTERAVPGTCGAGADCFLDSMTPVVSSQQTVGKRGTRPSAGVADAAGDLIGQNGASWLSLRCVGVLLSVIRAPTLSHAHLLAFLSIARILRDSGTSAAFRSAGDLFNKARIIRQFKGDARLEPAAATPEPVPTRDGESGICISRSTALTKILPQFLRTAVSMLRSSVSCFDRRYTILSALMSLSSMVKEAPSSEALLLLEALSDAVDRCVADLRRESSHSPHTRLFEGQSVHPLVAPAAAGCADQGRELPGCPKPRYSHMCPKATCRGGQDAMGQPPPHGCLEDLSKTSIGGPGLRGDNSPQPQDSSPPFPAPIRGWTAAAVAAVTSRRSAPETKAVCGSLTKKAFVRRWDLCAEGAGVSPEQQLSTDGPKAGAQGSRTNCLWPENAVNLSENEGNESRRTGTADSPWWPPGKRSTAEKELWVILPLLEILLSKLPERISDYSRRTAQQIHELLYSRRCCADTSLAERALLTLRRCGTLLRPTVGPQLHVLTQLCTAPCVSYGAGTFSSGMTGCHKWPSSPCDSQLDRCQKIESPSLDCGCCCCSPAPLSLRLAVVKTIRTLLTCCGFPLLIGAIVRRLMDILRCSGEDRAPIELRQSLLETVGTMQQQFPAEAGPYGRLLSRIILSTGPAGEPSASSQSATTEQKNGQPFPAYDANCRVQNAGQECDSASLKEGGSSSSGGAHVSARLQVKPKGAYTVGHHIVEPSAEHSPKTTSSPRRRWACPQDAAVEAKEGVRFCGCGTAQLPHNLVSATANDCPSGVERCEEGVAFREGEPQQKQAADEDVEGCALLQDKRSTSKREGQSRQSDQQGCVSEEWNKQGEIRDEKRGTARRRRSSVRARARGRGGPRPGRPQTAAELWKNCDFNTKTELRCWFRSISVAMLKECRAPALRACLPVALHEPSVAAALAPAAFLTYWAACCSKGQLQLMHIVGRAFRRVLLSSHISLSSLHQILNFVELTERQRWPLPVDTQLLAAVAEKCQAYAKAVRYREELWLADPGGSVEALIRLNNELHRVEVARGVLVHAQKNLRLPVKECWYVQLNEWEQALEAYEQREREDPNNVEWLKGKMRCLGALGEWERLALVADDLWRDIDTEVPESPSCFEHSSPQSGTFGGPYRSLEETAQTPTSQDRSRACSSSMPFSRLGGSQEAVNNEAAGKRSGSQRGQGVGLPRPQKLQRAGSSQSHLAEKRRETASLAASAAFHFRDWKGLQRCVQWFPSADSYERAFYTAVLCIQRGDFPAALERIQRARQLLDPELTVLLAESYERAYPALVSLQQLAELEEIVEALELRRKRHEEQQKSEGTWRSAVESGSLRTQQFFRHEEEDDEEQEAVLDTLQRLWRTRLATCEARADTWQEILRVRSLILPPHEDAATWLRFSSLCRRQHRARLSLEILRSLRGHHHTRGDVRVALEAFKVLHSVGRRLEAQLLLSSFCCGFVTAFFNGQPEQLLCPQGSDVPICVGAASLLEYRAVTPWTQHGNPMCSSQGASFHARPVDPGASAVIIPDSVSLERKFFERIRETPLSRDGSRGFEHSVLRLRQQLMKIVHPVRCLPRQIVLVMLLDEMGDRDVAGCLRGSLGSALEGVRSVWRSGELASEGVQNLGHSVSGGCPTPSLSADLGDTLRDGRRVADRKGGSYEDASWRLCLDMCSPDLHGGLRQWNVGSATGVTKDEVLRLLSTSHLKLAQWTKDIYNSGRGGPFLLHDVNSCCVTGTRNLRGAVGGDNSGRRANHGLLTPPLRLSTPSDTTAGVLAEESWASDVDAVFQILHWQRRAVLLQFSSAKAWSAWAITNFQVVETLKRSTHSPQSVPDSTRLFPLECRKPGLDHDCGLGPCAVTLGTPSSHLPSGSCAANSSPSARSSETECLVRHYSSRDGSYGRLRVYPASTAVSCSGLSLEWRHAEFDNGLLWEAPYADSAMLLNQPPLLPEALRNPHSACSNPSQGCRGPDIGSSCSREASCQAPSCRKPADLCAVRERSTGVEPALTSDVDAPDRPGGRPRNVPRSDEETDCGKPSKQAVLRSLLPHFVVEAVRGFLRSIELCPIRSQQDVLRLLKLWFEHTDIPVVSSLVQQGVYTVPLATWLDVLPQLLGRLSSANSCLRSSLVHLLGKAARSFPQELIFPVAVASKSTNALLSSCACTLLHIIASQRRELVQQAMLVSQELVRASALWEERWLRCLEQASEAYHTAQDCQKVVEILEPMHAEISRGPQTFSETLFLQKYGRELESARVYLRRYHRSGNRHDIDQCWMFYLRVFSRLLRDTQNLRHLDLREVSASLAEMKDLQLAVPGTAGAGRDYPLIQSFQTEVLVLTSKQRPRKMGIVGSDGREWPFLLKGQDDLTQDERIMQALRLINHLMERNVDARRKELSIPVYSIVPLSPCAGLIGWVRNTETLFSLIKAFRQQDGIPVNHEQVVLKSLYHKYEALTLLQKVNLFEQTAAATSGQALRRVLWLQSRGSEDWLVRRANFCKSVAVMSMVGYILGLGDRHPSNLLLMRDSGRVAHIDFSDCFEVAAHRKKFPERVPFRLTRMIVGALESGGVEGAFRATCEQVMALLRYNRDAIIAMLEASFLHESPTARKLHQVFGPQHASAACCRTPGDTKRNVHSKLGFRRGARSSDVQPPDLSPGFTPRSRGVSQDCCSRLSAESSATSVLRSHRVGCAGGSKSSEGWGSNERTISRSARASRSEHGTLQGSGDGPAQDLGSINAEDITCCARWAIARVASKLAGRDFEDYLDIPTQVDRLIDEAVSVENLCVAFVGWCPFW